MLAKTIKSGALLRKTNIFASIALLLTAGVITAMPKAFASTMTKASVLETNMNAAGAGAFYVDFKAGAADSAGSLTILFNNAGFSVAASQTATTACTTQFPSATGLPGTLTSSGSGQTVTVAAGALTSGTEYCAALTSATAVTNPAAGTYTATITDGTDTTNVGLDVISNDQINVDATVPPSFTLAFGGNTDHLGSLASGTIAHSSGLDLTVQTNAANGWGLWAEDTNAGLKSVAANKTINTVATGGIRTLSAGTEGYGLGVTSGNGTTNYTSNGTSTAGGLSTSAFNEIATAGAPTASTTVHVVELAAISGITPAAPDYSDTITIIGAGSF